MQTNIEEVKAQIAEHMQSVTADFLQQETTPESVKNYMTHFLQSLTNRLYSKPEDYDIQLVVMPVEKGYEITPGNLQTFVFLQKIEIPPTLAQLEGLTAWTGEHGTYSIENGQYYYKPTEPTSRITFTAQLDPDVLRGLINSTEQSTENRAATVGIICNTSANFVHLKNAFGEREDLAAYKLLMISDDKRAGQYANIIDFAVIYVRPNESGLNDRARMAYKVLDRHEVKIRLQFFQVVNYTEK